MSPSRTRPVLGGLAALTLLPLAACAGGSTTADRSDTGSSSTAPSSTASSPAAASSTGPLPGSGEREVSRVTPRVLVADTTGLTLLDADSGAVLHRDARKDSFLRLNPAGDGRRVLVTDGDRFTVYDTGIEVQPHGDHAHAYTYAPGLTQVSYPSKKAGHVVAHAGRTVLFGDGDGSILSVATEDLGNGSAPTQRSKTKAAHHGVAVALADGSLLHTEGTEDARSTVTVTKDGKTLGTTDDCPGVHGEATAQADRSGDVVVLGCENGPVVWRGGSFHKVPVKDAYARSGNLAGSDDSPVVLGDYKVDKDAETEHPTRVSLIDTRNDSVRLVELGSTYWFRSLARGPEGEALVLTADGKLVVIDPDKGTISKRIPVISAWKEPAEWQDAGPSIKVVGERAYVTDPAKKQLVVVDLASGAVLKRHTLPTAPVEIAVTDGKPAGKHDEHAGHAH